MRLEGRRILGQPQPHFAAVKGLFGHGCLGMSKGGRPVWVMRVSDCLSSQTIRPHVDRSIVQFFRGGHLCKIKRPQVTLQ